MPEPKCRELLHLEPWKGEHKPRPEDRGPLENMFVQMFSLREKIGSILMGGASIGVDAHYDARQTLLVLSQMADKDQPRAIIQLDDQSEAIVLDIVKHKGVKVWQETDAEEGVKDPIIFVRYAYHTKHNTLDIYNVAKSIAESSPQVGTVSIKCATIKEMQILNEMFLANSKRIPDEFQAQLEAQLDEKLLNIPMSHTSYITPLLKPYNKAPKGNCFMCGKSSKAVCAKCKVMKYCSKECQKKHWKEGHKKVCRTPEEIALGEAAAGDSKEEAEEDVDLENPWVDIDPKDTPPEMNSVSSISYNLSTRCRSNISQAHSVFDGIKRDKVMTVKVQIPPGSHPDQFKPIMIYNQGKTFQVMGLPQNMISRHISYRRLHQLVQQSGFDGGLGCGGCKAYLDAYVREDGVLRVMLNNLHKMQRW